MCRAYDLTLCVPALSSPPVARSPSPPLIFIFPPAPRVPLTPSCSLDAWTTQASILSQADRSSVSAKAVRRALQVRLPQPAAVSAPPCLSRESHSQVTAPC